MRHGMTAKEAVLDALKRVSRNYDDDPVRLAQFDLNFYAIRKDGDYAGASLWNGRVRDGRLTPRRYTVQDGAEARHESCLYLYQRKT
jgi:N4-(beta-N-acetylglucosaminyl)-L-asparaginase